mgnify:CR=1 FL=1
MLCLSDGDNDDDDDDKGSTHSYCALRDNAMTDLPRDATQLEGMPCDECMKTTVATMLQWKPPTTSITAIKEKISESLAALRQTAQRCGVSVMASGLTRLSQVSSAAPRPSSCPLAFIVRLSLTVAVLFTVRWFYH